ncbi:MAG TPA: hypothetical protein VJ951_06910, partial [Bacteroidales bacterium]|nr:hypothetical protein [Bacteroidales bacterium]
EYKAVMAANERVMVWMTSQKFYEAIMMSVKQNGKWTDPVNITPQVGSDGEMEPTGLSADGKDLLLVVRGQYDSDIYHSRYDGVLWSKAEPLKGDINSNFTEDHASFFPGEDSILIASDRRGSIGGLDLYVSRKLQDGTWGEPYNLGALINTEQDETSGYISPDGKYLVFSSKGHFNMGGYDVFQSEISENGAYIRPFNIGYPINTTNDNLYFIPLKDGQSGIYSLWDDDGVGNRDIWFYEIIPQETLIAKALTRLSEEDFTIKLTDPETGEEILLKYDSVEDKISIQSSTGKQYNVVYSRDE